MRLEGFLDIVFRVLVMIMLFIVPSILKNPDL